MCSQTRPPAARGSFCAPGISLLPMRKQWDSARTTYVFSSRWMLFCVKATIVNHQRCISSCIVIFWFSRFLKVMFVLVISPQESLSEKAQKETLTRSEKLRHLGIHLASWFLSTSLAFGCGVSIYYLCKYEQEVHRRENVAWNVSPLAPCCGETKCDTLWLLLFGQ